MRMRRSFSLLTIIVATCLPIAAQENLGAMTYGDGRAAYEAGDYERAFKIWKFQAEWGDAQSQTSLGVLYYLGEGTPRSYAQSLQWNRKAANQDNSYGQVNLAEIYEKGTGADMDLREALRIYEKAAAQDNPVGITGAARVKAKINKNAADWPEVRRFPVVNSSVPDGQSAYEVGDFEQAFAVYSYHAARRDPLAQTFLGYLYDHGQGTYQSYLMGAYWHQLSANQGHVYGMINFGNAYESGKGVLKNQGKALELYKKASEKGEAQGTEHAARLEAEMLGRVKRAPKLSWTPQTLTETAQLAGNYADQTGFSVVAWSLTDEKFDVEVNETQLKFLDIHSVKDVQIEGKTFKQAIYHSEYLRDQKFAMSSNGTQEIYRSRHSLRLYDCAAKSDGIWSYQIFGGNEVTGKFNNYESNGPDAREFSPNAEETVGAAMLEGVCSEKYVYKPQ